MSLLRIFPNPWRLSVHRLWIPAVVITAVVVAILSVQWYVASNKAITGFEEAIHGLAGADSIELRDPDALENPINVSDQSMVQHIATWIRTQPLSYDASHSKAISNGGVCGCRPWVIQFGDTERTIQIHMHHIIVNGKVAFRPEKSLDLEDFRSVVNEANEPVR